MVHRGPGAAADRDVARRRSASAAGSNSGASTTQRKLQALSSIRPPRRPISSRAAPSRARLDLTAPAAKKTQSPGCGADVGGQAGLLLVGEVLGDRAAELAVLLDQHVGEAAGAALLGPLLPGVELLARLARSAGHHDGADVRRLEHPERRVLEVVGALDELLAHPQVGLVGAVARHRLGVGHPRERAWARRTPIELPQRDQDLLGDGDDVVLVDEAHLDVELGELRLAVGAEVLVAVAARDLVVALHAGDHQQLLEQLRALRQGVPAARAAAGPAPGSRGRPRGCERVSVGVSISTKSCASRTSRAALLTLLRSRSACVGAGAAQVEVAVLEPGLLPHVDVVARSGTAAARRR